MAVIAMQRFNAIVLSLFLTFAPASAQMTMTGVGQGDAGGVAVPYQGPGDILASNWKAWWSVGRVFSAAQANTSTSIADLVAVTGGAAVCTLRGSSSGKVDLSAYCPGTLTPASACAAASGGSCLVAKLYDQSGNSNPVSQATLANMPGITFAAQNGLPCLSTTGSASIVLSTTGSVTLTSPIALMSVSERNGLFTTVQVLVRTSAGTFMQYRSVANGVSFGNGTTLATTSGTPDSAFLALIGDIDVNANADSVLVSNGSVVAGPAATGTLPPTGIISLNGPSDSVDGFVCEGGINDAFLNSTQYGDLTTNMRSSTNGWNF